MVPGGVGWCLGGARCACWVLSLMLLRCQVLGELLAEEEARLQSEGPAIEALP